MDIERLNELRKRLEYNSELEDEEIENLWELIDAEIARQSATKEIQEAIEWIEEVLSNNNIWRDGDFGIPVAKSRKYEATRQLILSFLQTYVQKRGENH
jgi:reverse gyrase